MREREIVALDASGEKVWLAIDTSFAYGLGSGGAGPQTAFLEFSHTDLLDALVRLARLEDAERSSGTYEEARPIWFKYSIPYATRPRHFVWGTAGQANDIENILGYIHEACTLWYQAGFERGRDLISRVAEAGSAELNRITIEAGRPR